MIYITIDKLPSGFKPYKFKSFKMKALNVEQAMKLGKSPSLTDIRSLIGELTDDIDANELVSIDLKYLISVLALNIKPNKTWNLSVTCPYCKKSFTKVLGLNDFPPIPSFEESDEYPLKIDDGTHIYELGYASIEDLEDYTKKLKDASDDDRKLQLESIIIHILSIDGNTDRNSIRDHILKLNDLELVGLMAQVVAKFFLADNTYAELECQNKECKKSFKLHLSAIEVTNYTPFLDEVGTSRYKTNFRI